MKNLLAAQQAINTEGFSQEEKTKLQSFIDSLMAIVHFFSDLFTKSTKLTIAPVGDITPTEQSIKYEFFAEVNNREKEKGNPVVWYDNDLWRWFPTKELGFTKAFETVLYRFKQTINHRNILAEAERLGIKKVYSYTKGLAIIRALVLAGEVDEVGKGVIVYFMSPQQDALPRFSAFRVDNRELRVRVHKVGPGNEWRAGFGTCFDEGIKKAI